ncbi:MAG: hypothetical protein LLG20_16250 [Acidobacteriales bacterium]|nr:hypothetical protein [Terriglobales bacterium]
MRRLLALVLSLGPTFAAAPPTVLDLSRQIRELTLDAEECYHVRELNFQKEDIRFFLSEGYLVFSRPIAGRPLAAVFATEMEGGDAEILLFPPLASERRLLASYTQSPNLNEHIRTAVFFFTDSTHEMLMERIRAEGSFKKKPEAGVLVASGFQSVVRNLVSSYETRIVDDLLTRRPDTGFFYAAVTGKKLGNFDLLYDPRMTEQINVGQVTVRNQRVFFDSWTSFQARAFRNSARQAPGPEFTLGDFRIDATLSADLNLRVTTRVTLEPSVDSLRSLPFEISRRMRILGARIDGQPAEVFQRESMRSNLLRGPDNEVFLVLPPTALEKGRRYEIEFVHEGNVISEAGNRVYYVGARGSWYPNRAMQFAQYDLTFHYPKNFDLVATGDIVENREQGEWRLTRRRTSAPVRLAGFNLGDYQQSTVKRGGYTVEVYANRKLEPTLARNSQSVLIMTPQPGPTRPSRRHDALATTTIVPPPASTTTRTEMLAAEIASSLEFMAASFGPPPFKTLTVSPVPGAFGQGFPGLVYLSTLSYLAPADRPPAARSEWDRLFFSEILHAHETAHQWWGNAVTAAGYQDEWLMESLANYSALLYIERRKGTRVRDSILQEYKTQLLAPSEDGRSVESVGPIVLGSRLKTSLAPDAWRTITYEKGSWIMHMLRRKLGDERFLAALKELCRRYRYRGVSTDQFRDVLKECMPPNSSDPALEEFFERWVYGTGIPHLKLSSGMRGKAPNLTLRVTVTQTGVEDDFSVEVPVEVQLSRGKAVTRAVRTSSTPASIDVRLARPPLKVLMDPSQSILAVRE